MTSRLKKNWTSVYKTWKSCSRSTRKLEQKLNAKQNLCPTTYVSLTHQQHRSWFLRAITQLWCIARL